MNRVRGVIFLLLLSLARCGCWELPDVFRIDGDSSYYSLVTASSNTLSLHQVSEMRVRDIKRRLARNHGYDAHEIARMLDKKELIHALAFEEHKLHQTHQAAFQRQLFWHAMIVTVVAGVLVLIWPLLRHAWEIAHINFVVYTDRKKLEARRCWELRSLQGCLGVAAMFVVDVLQLWLTGSVILSWVMTSKYFFPIPSIPVRPAAMMGGPVSTSSLAQYGINVGPMAITWAFRFLRARLERWTGKAMSSAQRTQRKQQRANETAEEKAARKERKAAKRAAREAAATQQHRHQPTAEQTVPPPPFENVWKENGTTDTNTSTNTDPTSWQANTEPSIAERRQASGDAAERRWQEDQPHAEPIFSKMEELD